MNFLPAFPFRLRHVHVELTVLLWRRFPSRASAVDAGIEPDVGPDATAPRPDVCVMPSMPAPLGRPRGE
jgi:hypothetical protein